MVWNYGWPVPLGLSSCPMPEQTVVQNHCLASAHQLLVLKGAAQQGKTAGSFFAQRGKTT